MLSAILWALVAGTVLGLLGKLVAPGDRDNIPLWLTILCGIGGGMLGTWLYEQVYGIAGTPGVDWWRHIWQVAIAAVLVMAVATVAARRRPS